MNDTPASQQVAWFEVHLYVAAWLELVGDWPTAGTPEWQALADDDPKKLVAVLDDGQHWALRKDALQEAQADASKAVSDAVDWPALARASAQRTAFYAARAWLKRRAA